MDSNGNRTEAVVSVLVHEAIEIPAKPEASDDQVVTEQDQPVSIAALSNDAAGDSATLALYSFGQPQNGAVTLGPKGNLLYTPHENFAGDDHFGYVITDEHGNKSSATIYMTVTTVNEAPAPLLTQLSTNEDTELSIDLSALIHDPDGDALTIEGISAQNGTVIIDTDGTIVYTPNPDFHGTDTLLYTVSDTENTTTTAAVTMTVKPINDAPVAAKDEGATQEDHPVMIDVLANDHDIDGDTLNIEIIDRPEHGSVSRGEDGVLVYTPAPNFHGQEQFEYTVSDGHGGAYTSSVTVVVASVNDAPEASDDSASTTEDAAIAIQVLQNDDDLDGDALKIEAFDQPANGSTALDSAGIFTYTPNIGFNGQDSFTCSVSDGNSKSSQ